MRNLTSQMTDSKGAPLLDEGGMTEPLPDSVVLVEGPHGTAFQRHFADGLWHSHAQRRVKWEKIIKRRNVVLVYDAEPRPETQPASLVPASEFGRLA